MVSGQSFGSSAVSLACITSMCSVQCFRGGHSLRLAFGSLHYPYLGVELSSTLDWSHHIDNEVNQANKTLSFLQRNLSYCPESIMKRISL